MSKLFQNVSFLAGNSRVERLEDGTIKIQPELAAFQAALERARQIHPERLGTVAVAFDHRGIFRKQFLVTGLSNKEKRNPHLHQIHPAIRAVFAPVAEAARFRLDRVMVIHEDSARSHLDFLYRTNRLPDHEKPHIFDRYEYSCEKEAKICGVPGESGPRLGCAAITWQYYWKASGEVGGPLPQLAASPAQPDHLLEVFIEQDPWCQPEAYTSGVLIAQRLGPRVTFRLNAVSKTGKVHSGEILPPP